MNKIRLLKFIDCIIGKVAVTLISFLMKYPPKKPESLYNVLFIRPGGIGDAVLLLPAIKALKTMFPDAATDVLCEKRNAGIFLFSDAIRRVYLYDRDWELFKSLRNRYDVVIDTEQWHRLSAAVAYLTKAPVRIGFGTNERRKLFTEVIPYSHDEYEVYSFFHLIEPLTGTVPKFSADEPFIDADDAYLSPALLEQTQKGETVAIFPGASVRERRWGGERFGEVARGLHEEGCSIIILGSSADSGDAALIKRFVPDAHDLTGKTTLKDVAALLKHCSLLITADSGLMHLAYAVGTPTVSLFGSGIEKKWAPRGKRHRIINKHHDCSPCTKFGYTPRCERGVKCLHDTTVGEVLSEAELLLKGTESR